MSVILEEALREYNETHPTMDLVLFEDAMKHVSSPTDDMIDVRPLPKAKTRTS